MFSRTVKRAVGAIGASALLVVGGTAAQAALGPDEVRPDTDNYLGWHQGDPDGSTSFEVRWDGLYFGSPNNAQIINGLVEEGEVSDEVLTADELVDKLDNSGLIDAHGDVFFQVGLHYVPEGGDADAPNWTTLRPVDAAPEGAGEVGLDVTADWTGTSALQGESAPLAELLGDLGDDAEFMVAAYGVFAQTASFVSGITFDGDTAEFGFDAKAPYSVSGDPEEVRLADLTAADDSQVEEVCEGIQLGDDGQGELLFEVDPIEVQGETNEERWADLYAILGSLDGEYTTDSDGGGEGGVTINLLYGPTADDANSITLRPSDDAAEGSVIVEGELDNTEFEDGDEVVLGELLQSLVDNADLSIWVDGFSIYNVGGPIVLHDTQFYDNVNLVYPGVCDVDDETPTPEPPADDGDDDDDDAATPVVKEPSFTG